VGWRSRPRWAVTRFDDANTAALKLRQEDFVIDGETVAVGLDGGSDFDALGSSWLAATLVRNVTGRTPLI
jgi:ATP-dependent DNA ligase